MASAYNGGRQGNVGDPIPSSLLIRQVNQVLNSVQSPVFSNNTTRRTKIKRHQNGRILIGFFARNPMVVFVFLHHVAFIGNFVVL